MERGYVYESGAEQQREKRKRINAQKKNKRREMSGLPKKTPPRAG